MSTVHRILAIFTIFILPVASYSDVVAIDLPQKFLVFEDRNDVHFAPGESVVVSFSLPRPGNIGMDRGVFVTYDVDVLDQNGLEVGSTVLEEPVAGLGLVGIEVTDITPIDALLIINDEIGSRVALVNGRLLLQIAVSARRIGRNPATGEAIQINASNVVIGSMSILGSDGSTHATTGTVKWFNTSKGFGFIAPDDGSEL